MEEQCPECGSNDTIPWGSGYICRDCGDEFGTNSYSMEGLEIEDESVRFPDGSFLL